MMRSLFIARVALALVYEAMLLTAIALRFWLWPGLAFMFALQCFIVYCDVMSGAFLRKDSNCSNSPTSNYSN